MDSSKETKKQPVTEQQNNRTTEQQNNRTATEQLGGDSWHWFLLLEGNWVRGGYAW
ncbi:hypothetical protein M3661_15935 [Paenibacillus sp. MER 180]|uniref:hypothetical protein n=1 Tax=Paenibacillus sp. MER 180 TaxID=2939570 RepID=UPI00203F8F35|nr:hypothetical protein [Paenibacillus sp. MER 180]MCM3291621.1 hypothetical protein [Paenibacillus sp. MER 180]